MVSITELLIKLELLNLELGYVDQKELRVVYATVEERLENVCVFK